MEKDKDVKIFMLCHKNVDYGFLDNKYVTPIECGADIIDNNVCELKDNTGDNISRYNQFFTEDTGIYWIWKNVKNAKYKGQVQYRRRFSMLNEEIDFGSIFSQHDAIIAEPMDLPDLYMVPGLTLESQYLIAHNIDDILLMEEIIKELYPEYTESYDKYVKNGRMILYSNGFILKSEDYDKYCEQLFTILNEWLKRMGIYYNMDRLHDYVYESV